MSHTCICLLSDQRMQNILPLYQKGMNFDRVILLSSCDDKGKINTRFEKIALDLQHALGDRAKWDLFPIPVDPMDPASTEKICCKIIRESGPDEQFTINITGGLKPMSIGAYLAGLDSNTNLLYVDTQTETFFHYMAGEARADPFNLNPMRVQDILTAHGRILDENVTRSLEKPEYDQLVDYLFSDSLASINQLLYFQTWARFEKFKPTGELAIRAYTAKRLPWLFPALLDLNMVRMEGKMIYLSKSAVGFLNGGWLESFVLRALQKTNLFMDVVCRQKVANVENELDVACTLNGKLGIVECKSGSLKGQQGQGILNRLRTLKDTLGGTFAKSFLVTTTKPEYVSKEFEIRAKEYVSEVIHLDGLVNVGEIIARRLSSRSRNL